TYPSGRVHWNAFGATVKPNRGENMTITCEINLGFTGNVRAFAGAVARDARGHLYLMHRGRIGGGREGIGQSLFLENFRGESVRVSDGESSSTLALLGDLDSRRLTFQVAHFVHEVQRIKELSETVKGSTGHQFKFSREPEFRARYKPSEDTIEPSADHGLVVN